MIKKIILLLRPFAFFRFPFRVLSRKALLILIPLIIVIPLFLYFFSANTDAAPWSSVHGAWQKRKQLTLTNNSGSTLNANVPYQITVDTRAPGNPGDYQSDCDDLRVVYQPNAATNTELSRAYHLAQGATSCTDSGATIVTFPLQANITNNSSSTDYYLYYANPTAPTPSATALSGYNVGAKTATFVAPFNGSTTALAAGSGTPTTATGAIRYSGNKGSALSLNGVGGDSGDYIVAAAASSIDNLPNGDFTFETWFNRPNNISNGAFMAFADKNYNSGTGWRVHGSPSNRTIHFQIDFGTTDLSYETNNNAYSYNTWNHIAVSYTASTKTAKIFINGVEAGGVGYATATAGVGTYSTDAGSNLVYGRLYTSCNCYNGLLEELRISNVARYSTTFTPQTTPFVRDANTKVLYHFDENGVDPRNTGGTIDDSGNANLGTYQGSPKYIAGLIGIDNSNGSTATGISSEPIQSYAGHQGIFIELGKTNLVTNPSFENSTYNTNWTAGANITAAENTSAPYYKFGTKSVQLTGTNTTGNTFTTNINAGSTAQHTLSAYVYRATGSDLNGYTMSSTQAQLVYNGSSQTTTYTNIGGGWWLLSYTAAGINGAADYGIEVKNGQTVYVDGFQLEGPDTSGVAYTTSYIDGSLGNGYAWSGTAHASTSTRTAATLNYSATSNIASANGSFSAWVKSSPTHNIWAAVATGWQLFSTGTGADRIDIGVGSGNLAFRTCDSGCTTVSTSSTGFSQDRWHHIVGTWTAGGNMILYVNGSSVGTPSATRTFTMGGTLMIGNQSGSYFDGQLSDVRVYSSGLSSGEVTDLYNAGLGAHSQVAQEKDAPVGYWKFDEGQGSTANNSTNLQALKGTLNNTPTWQTENMCVLGKCLWFDGTNNENISVTDNDSLDFSAADNFSVGAWVKRNGVSSAINYIVSKADTSTGGYKVWMDADGDLCFGIDDDSSWGPDISACSTNADFDDNRWHYVVGVRDQSGTDKIYVYVDGVDRSGGGTSDTTTTTLANTNTFYIGVDRDGTSNEWLGFIDEVKVFPQVFTADQIKAQYNLGSASVLGTNTQNMSDALSDGLVGYWKMEEANDATRTDSSGNNNTLTESASDTIVQTIGKFSYGADFESGDTEDLSITDGSQTGLQLGSAFSMGTWMNLESYTSGCSSCQVTLIRKGQTATSNMSYALTLAGDASNNSAVSFKFSTNGTSYNNSTGLNGVYAFSTGTWYHVFATYDGTVMKIYVNGNLIYSQAASGTPNNDTDSVYVGSTFNGYYDGVLDETRIYNRALSGAEVQQLYNWAPGPVGYWKMDEGSWNGTSGEVIDSSGNGNNGTSANGPTVGPGKYGRAGVFDNSNDQINAGTGIVLANSSFSLGAWVKKTTNGGKDWVIGLGSNVGDNGLLFGFNNTDKFRCGFWSNDLDDPNTTTDANWHYWSCTYDASNNSRILYKDGVRVNSDTASADFAGTGTLNIGYSSFDATSTVAGSIDEVKIYQYPRTQAQVIEDMNAGHPAPGSPVGTPLGHWKFDEGADNTCSGGSNDACNSGNSGNTYDGTSTATRTNLGKYGRALDFDGSDDVVTISNNTAIDMDGNLATFTFSSWINPDSDGEGDTGQIFNKATAGGDGTYFRVDSQDGSNNLDLECNLDRATTDTNVNIADAFTISTWNYVSCTWDGTTLRVYVNGIERGSSSSGSGAIATDTFNLLIGGGTADNFDGKIDEFKVYSSILTADQIKLDMNNGKAEVLGAIGTTSNTQPNAAANEYCPPDSATAVCTGPAGMWDFEEGINSTAYDKSGNANNGSISGAIYDRGKKGKALNYDGSDDVTTVTNASPIDLNTNSGFTYEAWIWADGAGEGSGGQILNKGATNFLRVDTLSGGNLDIEGQLTLGTANATLNVSTAITVNSWNHIAMSYTDDADDEITIYVNGVNKGSSTNGNGSITAESNNLLIGGPTTDNFDGKIDDFRFYGYERTRSQVAWDYNKGAPIAHWKLDECQGTTINDSSGSGISGTLTVGSGGTENTVGNCATSSTAWGNGATGKRNYSIDFDGTDDYVSFTTPTALQLQNFSYSAWIKRGSISTYQAIFAYTNTTSSGGTSFYLSNTNRLEVAKTGTSTCSGSVARGITDTTNWHFVTVTYDGSNCRFYVDGIFDTAPAFSQTFTYSGNALIGGTATNDSLFDGQIDDVKIHSYPLTATQVKTLYNEGATRYGPASGAP